MRNRLSLDLDQSTRDNLEALVKKTNSASLTETIKRALALWDVITDHTQHGGKLVFRHQDGREETLRILG